MIVKSVIPESMIAKSMMADSMTAKSALPETQLSEISKTIHVLTLTPFYPTSTDAAQGCFIAESVSALGNTGIQNTVFAVQPRYRASAITNSQVHPARQIRFIALPGGMGLSTAGAFLFARLLNDVRRLHGMNPIHLIHAHAALPCGHAAALLSRELNIPFVVTVHGLDAYFTQQVSGFAGKWCKRVAKFVYGSAACAICVSERVREKVLEAAPSRIRTEVVYNGVDPEFFSPGEESCIEGHEGDTILCVGNLISTKGQDLLLCAFAKIYQNFPKCFCEFIGDGPERKSLIALASKLGIADSVRFRGRCTRPQVAEAMRRCTLFVLPSRYEGLGCVYLEAMATGKVAIGCFAQGIEEVIEHGANGWLVHPENQQELADALLDLLKNISLRKQIGIAARQTILREFTLAHQAQHLFRIYEACAQNQLQLQ